MTATEELRRLLDEHGVEWRRTPHYSSESVDNETVFQGEGIEWLAHDHLNGRLGLGTLRYEVTPEQAIAATLGSGTCALPETRIDHGSIEYNGVTEWRKCSACGEEVLAYPAHFCPNCGRRVV